MMLRGLLLSCSRGAGVRLLSSFSADPPLPPNLILPPGLKDGPTKIHRPPVDPSRPVLRSCKMPVPSHLAPKPVWLESLIHPDQEPQGLVHLHPDVFDVPPRVTPRLRRERRSEVEEGSPGRRKAVDGLGREASDHRFGGEVALLMAPRGPISYYYMLPMKLRVLGLKTALTMKLAQNDLHIIDSIDISSPEPQYLMDLLNNRHWGQSVLIVDVNEEMPENILSATADLKKVNLIPAIGINVYSMLKHDTVLITVGALDFLEEKLLWQDLRYSPLYNFKLPYSDFP